MSAKRLEQGGRIDCNHSLSFFWEGKEFTGFSGDSLASALLANDRKVLGRSFKYHRPRGVMSAGVEESGAIVTLGSGNRRDPNVKATMQELYEGLEASGQNAWPSVRFDMHAINGLFSRFLLAGFYYKTFMGIPPFEWGKKGTKMWMRYEKLIRSAAGMGEASRQPDPDCYDHMHGYCDVLVVGAGPAGLAAARVVAKAGLDVVIVEQDHEPGGNLLHQPLDDSEKKRTELIDDLQRDGVRIMTRTTAFGLYDDGVAGLLERVTDHLPNPHKDTPRQRFWIMRARKILLCTGAIERHIAFGNNDRPGVMNVDAARAYLNRYAVRCGERIVVSTNNDSSYSCASELAQAGAIVHLLDTRAVVAESLMSLAGDSGVSVQTRCAAYRVKGRRQVQGVETAVYTSDQWSQGGRIRCDTLLVSGGWSPVINLISHRGVKPQWNEELACFIAPDEGGVFIAGSAAAIWNTADCIASGQSVATRVAKSLGATTRQKKGPQIGGWQTPIQPVYEIRIDNKPQKCLVDPQHDVTTDDVRLAHQEGFVSVEHLKRYTTLGMATDGGKMGNVIGLALMAEALGKEIPEVGTTTFRPPYTPVAIGALKGRNVGEHFRPLRRTPMHDWNLANGATMTMAGLWHRPWYFAGESEGLTEAYIREAETVRKTVGLCDVTSLGKIAIQGPDATKFLNRIYTNPFAKLAVGKARYGIMLRDDGLVMDDGTTWRLSETDYFMTTTTAHAAKVMTFMEELLQVRWQDLKVHLTSVSEQWAGCAVAGPQSRSVLQSCLAKPEQADNENLPFMGVIETTLTDDIACRIARISFSGERAYEVYVPSDYAPALMDRLWACAESLGGCLYGLEALGTLRIEKGHVTGAELDGRISIDDAGLGKMASPGKSFIGSVLRKRSELLRESRPMLVGIKPKKQDQTFNAGALLCHEKKVAGLGDGWVTAVTHSPVLGHWIGLGFISGGYKAWEGKTVIAADPVRKGNVEVEIISPHMYDPSGEKMYG